MLSGEKVRLIQITPRGLAEMARWGDDPETVKFLQASPRDLGEEWLRGWRKDPRRRILAIETAEGLIGIIQLEELTWRSRSTELRVCLGEPAVRGRGYGSDAIRSLLRHLFEDWKLDSVYLRVEEDNLRAIRCYEKCGFVKKGKVKRRGDTGNGGVTGLGVEEVRFIFMEARAGGVGQAKGA